MPEEAMLNAGVIDSTGVFDFHGFAERRSGIKVDDEGLVPENPGSTARFVAFVNRRRWATAQA